MSTCGDAVWTTMMLAGWLLSGLSAVGQGAATPSTATASTASQRMAETILRQWPAGTLPEEGRPNVWSYEEGVLLDGMTAAWQVSGDAREFAYVKASVDKYVTADGAIMGFAEQAHSLDNIEMGRAVLTVYRRTHDPRYERVAQFLRAQLAVQPRTASGGFWHKQVYPNQMWLDGAYMAEPFLAEYAATFQQTADFDGVAKQLLLMDARMRDAKTGLLRHGWDESKAMPWADKGTGLSPEVWSRAMGWYAMALVDVLEWMPKEHPQRAALVRALERTAEGIVQYQDRASGLWWQVIDQGAREGNYREASASCMFVYALAKGARMGYLPKADEAIARRGWEGVQREFVTTAPDGTVTLNGTVKVGGLGGTPYRSGTFAYYVSEKTRPQDAKGIGAYLMAGAEMEGGGK